MDLQQRVEACKLAVGDDEAAARWIEVLDWGWMSGRRVKGALESIFQMLPLFVPKPPSPTITAGTTKSVAAATPQTAAPQPRDKFVPLADMSSGGSSGSSGKVCEALHGPVEVYLVYGCDFFAKIGTLKSSSTKHICVRRAGYENQLQHLESNLPVETHEYLHAHAMHMLWVCTCYVYTFCVFDVSVHNHHNV